MKSQQMHHPMLYISWFFGQSSALFGLTISVIWGFGLIFLVSELQYAHALELNPSTALSWRPPLGFPIAGLGLALIGWFSAHLGNIRPPVAVLFGAALNLLAFFLALVAGIL